MHMVKRRFRFLIRSASFLPVIAIFTGAAQAYQITATIPPLSDIAAAITEGTDIKVDSLLSPDARPESSELTPHNLLQVRQSNLLLLTDPHYETFLGDTLDEKRNVIAMTSASGIKPVTQRGFRIYKMTDKGITVGPHDFDNAHAPDYHLWLNPDYALKMAALVRDHLVKAMPDDADTFNANYAAFATKIAATKKSIQNQLYATKSQGYIAYDDEYQYFDNSFNMHQIAIVKDPTKPAAKPGDAADAAGDDDASPSGNLTPERVDALQQRIRDQHVRCLVYDTPASKKETTGLAKQTGTTAVEINPFGSGGAPSADSYVSLLNDISGTFARCLNGS